MVNDGRRKKADWRVLIVGGGIAGQTLAVALTKRRIACEIVEIKRDYTVVGAGMYLQGNALRALDDIGVVDEVVATGFPPDGDQTYLTDAAGTLLAELTAPRIAGPDVPAMVPLRRQALHDILQRAVLRHGVTQRLGVTVDAIDEPHGADAVDVRFSNGTTGRFDLVVGADGIGSVVRRLCFGMLDPVYTGFANWRTLMPRPPQLRNPTWMLGGALSIGMMPLSDDCMYLAGVSREPARVRHAEPELASLMKTRFISFGGLAGELLATLTSKSRIVYTMIEEVHQPAPWFRGRTILVGDAAHASSPFWAQGASMAIEDVILLAQLLGEAEGEPQSVFPQWQSRRYNRCLWVQKGSLQAGESRHPLDPEAGRLLLSQVSRHARAASAAQHARLAEPI